MVALSLLFLAVLTSCSGVSVSLERLSPKLGQVIRHRRSKKKCDITYMNVTPGNSEEHLGNFPMENMWRGTHQWNIKITNNIVKMVPVMTSVYTTIATEFGGSRDINVTSVHIKWGHKKDSGSDHTINGRKYAGEMQIFHQHLHGESRSYAMAFLIKERSMIKNKRWHGLISDLSFMPNRRGRVRRNPSRYKTESKQDLYKLISDSSQRGYSPEHIMELAVRYNGTMTSPPCDDVTWTVFPRPIELSSQQMRTIRNLTRR